MKAALVNKNNIVENIIVWDETSEDIPGYTNVVVNDDVHVSIGFEFDPKKQIFVDKTNPDAWKDGLSNYELRRLSYPPVAELADAMYHQQLGNEKPMQEYLAKIEAVKLKYPL